MTAGAGRTTQASQGNPLFSPVHSSHIVDTMILESNRPRRRFTGAVMALAILLVPLAAPAGAGLEHEPGAQDRPLMAEQRHAQATRLERPPWTNTACPEMTDSITRLYTAYFDRQPDQGGFEFWLEASGRDGWNLDRMSRHFSSSDEFVTTYGDLTNAEFVDLIYANIHGREPDPGGRAFWTEELNSGRMSRGRVMIFFSESEEYVIATQTVTPLAGYLGWYPEGTTWSCGSGSATIRLRPGISHTDIFLDNFSREPEPYTIVSYDPNYADPLIEDISMININTYHYYANAQLSAAYGYLEFDMSDQIWWIVVDAPAPMVDGRPGWF